MENPQEGENNPSTKTPIIPNKDNKNHPLKNLPQMTTSLATTQLVGENPEHLLLGQNIYRKEIPNSRKKRAPSPIYCPSDFLHTFTDHAEMNHFVSASNSAHTAPELSLNQGFTNYPLRYVPEESLSQLERPHLHSAILHNPVSTQWQENGYTSIPSSTSYSPLGYSSPSYVSEPPPERPRPRFATLHHVVDATPQYPVNSYLQGPHTVWNSHPGYMSETPIPPQEEHPSWLTMFYDPAVEPQYETNNYPGDSRYSPHGYSYPSYTPETSIPPQGHHSGFTIPQRPAFESQHESDNYPSDSRYSTHGYSHPNYISEARLLLLERPRPRFSAPFNPAANAIQQVDSHFGHSRNNQYGYSPPNYTPEAPILPPKRPRPRFVTPCNPAGNTGYSSPKPMFPAPTMPPEKPRPHFATPEQPAATISKYKINSYLNSFDIVADHEPILHRQPEAPNVDIPIAKSLQTIGAKWVRTQCARKMASKLNEIEERHAENAQRFAALTKSLNKNTLAANQDNDQSNAAATDAKLEKNILAPHNDCQITNTSSANPEVSASHSTRTFKPPHPEFEDTTRDENDIHDEDYPCRIS